MSPYNNFDFAVGAVTVLLFACTVKYHYGVIMLVVPLCAAGTFNPSLHQLGVFAVDSNRSLKGRLKNCLSVQVADKQSPPILRP